jgi:hypothetical protein
MARLRATAPAARSVLDGREHGGKLHRVGAAISRSNKQTIKRRPRKTIKRRTEAYVPFGNSYNSGVYYGIQRTSRGGRWSWSPNALSPSTFGLKMEEPLVGDWLLIGAAEFGFNPYSGMLANAPRSLADNNLNPPANQIASGDGSRAGQWNDSQGFVGVSSKTYAR